MAPAYNPISVEKAWYEWWSQAGFFKPEYVESHHVGPEPPQKVSTAFPQN